MKHRHLVIISMVVVIGVIAFFAVSGFRLNHYEQLALERCQTLRDAIQDPNSFTLYDILVYPNPDQAKEDENEDVDDGDPLEYDVLFYISYGAANGFGGMIRETAIFQDATFMGNLSERDEYTDPNVIDETGILSAIMGVMSHEDELRAGFPYVNAEESGDWEGFITIDTDKIMKRLEN